MPTLGVRIEVRNQARVHLWYPEKHGLPYPALHSSTEGIDRFLTKNTQVGIRRSRDGYDVYAPNGFDDIAGMIVRPNPGPNFSAANYAGEGCAMEKAVAGNHGAAGRMAYGNRQKAGIRACAASVLHRHIEWRARRKCALAHPRGLVTAPRPK